MEIMMILFSGIVAISTVIYAVLTWKLVSETKKMREAQTEPKISITIQPTEQWINFIDMVIQNIGLGPAYNIKFKINSDFECEKGEFLSEKGFIKEGIKYLAPNQKFKFFLTSIIENYEEKIDAIIQINVNYKNSHGIIFHESFSLNFSEFKGISQIGKPPLFKIADNIKEIQSDFHHIYTGFKRLKIEAYSKKDVEEEREKILKEIKRKSGTKNI